VSSLGGGLAITVLLTAAFASAGELLLGRRSSSLGAWNESFLTGAGVAGALLFPLSLLFHHAALRIELGLLGIGLVAAVARALGAGPPADAAIQRRFDAVDLLLLLGVLAAAGAFIALDLRYNLFWDGLLIWASKAQVLFHEGFVGRAWYPDDRYELRHLTYPPLVPLFEALLTQIQGRFDFDAVKPVFIPFYLSLPISAYAAARSVASRRLAMASALMLAIVPLLVTREAAGGYADMPQAAFVAGVVSAAFRRSKDRAALPWILGGLTTVKAEGTILVTIASAVILTAWLADRELRPPVRRGWRAALVVAAFLALRVVFVRWLAVSDLGYVPLNAANLHQAIGRIPRVLHLCLVKALSPRRWGLLWPCFGLATAVLLARGTAREKALAAAAAVAAVAMTVPFLLTAWPLELQIDQAYPRLLGQVAPAAVAVVLFGYVRALATSGGMRYSATTTE
jgi:hypothetical protein